MLRLVMLGLIFKVRLVMLGFSGLEVFWHPHYGDIPTLHKTSEIFRHVMLYVKNLKFLTLEIFWHCDFRNFPYLTSETVNKSFQQYSLAVYDSPEHRPQDFLQNLLRNVWISQNSLPSFVWRLAHTLHFSSLSSHTELLGSGVEKWINVLETIGCE